MRDAQRLLYRPRGYEDERSHASIGRVLPCVRTKDTSAMELEAPRKEEGMRYIRRSRSSILSRTAVYRRAPSTGRITKFQDTSSTVNSPLKENLCAKRYFTFPPCSYFDSNLSLSLFFLYLYMEREREKGIRTYICICLCIDMYRCTCIYLRSNMSNGKLY